MLIDIFSDRQHCCIYCRVLWLGHIRTCALHLFIDFRLKIFWFAFLYVFVIILLLRSLSAQFNFDHLIQQKKNGHIPSLVLVISVFSSLNKDFGQGVGSSRGDKRLARMESNVKNRLVKLFTVWRDLLNAGLVLQIPKSNATVVTCKFNWTMALKTRTKCEKKNWKLRKHTSGE